MRKSLNFIVSSAAEIAIDLVVDGTVKGSTNKWHFDHHRKGGAPVQLLEIPNGGCAEASSIGTHMLDADALAAAVWATVPGLKGTQHEDRLLALAWVCDHLHIPEESGVDQSLEDWALDCVQGLKDQTMEHAKDFGVSIFGPEAISGDEKEAFMSLVLEDQYYMILDIIARDAWDEFPKGDASSAISKMASRIREEGRIQGPIVNLCGLSGFVNPLSYYRAMDRSERIAIVQRDFRGGNPGDVSFTVGINPLAGYAHRPDLMSVLARIQAIQPGWGGRAEVFGSPFKEPAKLTAAQILEICRQECNAS
jgi:hypothetical protein